MRTENYVAIQFVCFIAHTNRPQTNGRLFLFGRETAARLWSVDVVSVFSFAAVSLLRSGRIARQ